MSVTIKVNNKKIQSIKKYYQDFLINNSGDYIEFIAKKNNLIITAYFNNKRDIFKVVFLGNDALKEALIWDKNASLNIIKSKIKSCWIDESSQIGSDEVGTGDFFGPIVVVAACVEDKDIMFLKGLKVDDSKKINDDLIMDIAPQLIRKINYSMLCLDNSKYNDLIKKGENMNSIKAKMHNKALHNISVKCDHVKTFYIDQFASKELYYKYIKDENIILHNITFKTKAESYYPCVAVASIIARYVFLLKMKELSTQINEKIPLGANETVNKFAQKIVKKYGIKTLNSISKTNFKNYTNIIEK